ncbi:MAG: hypothetical protein C0582_00735 [Alphaproteobacteria bacterium]|mgnify:CR=1 FL=1|nr:MAG: hypothetical protein C0582_00735 [Alphaproteobacteria bacterium]
MDYFYAPIIGVVVGALVGLTGIGGGAVMAPLLLLVFGLDIQTVVATDLLFATITKLLTGGTHVFKERVDWAVAQKLWIGSLPATVMVLVFYFFNQGFTRLTWLQLLMGVMILVSGVSWFFSKWTEGIQTRKDMTDFKRNNLTIFFGSLIGLATSLTSVGAGSFGALVLRWLYARKMTIQTLIATEVIHAIPVSFFGWHGVAFFGKDRSHASFLSVAGIFACGLWGKLLYGTCSVLLP